MSFRMSFVLDLFDGPRSRASSLRVLDVVLRTLFEADVLYLRTYPETPLLYRSGVRFKADAPGQDDWQDIPTTLRLGVGDAEDLVAWRAAELVTRSGILARPAFDEHLDPCVLYPNGTREYPSAVLGGARELLDGEPKSGFYRLTFRLDLFNSANQDPRSRELSRKVLDVLLRGLFEIDREYLRAHPEAPNLYQSGVLYAEEPKGQEDWMDVGATARMGRADCEDLASWRAAELDVRHGIPARPVFKEQKREDGGFLYHIVVRYPNGREEDPSRILGMR